MNSNKEVRIVTNGCPENRIDAARIQEFFRQNGYRITSDILRADIIIFNTCGGTKNSENASIETIEQINSIKKPLAELIVCGCLPKINKQRLKMVYEDPVISSDEMKKISDFLKLRTTSTEIYANFLIDPEWKIDFPLNGSFTSYLKSLPKYILKALYLIKKGMTQNVIRLLKIYRNKYGSVINVDTPHTFCIKVCSGCLGNCTFCAIRLSRGRLKSKPLEKVVKEFKEGLNKGYKDFALLGTEVGTYGKDLGVDLTTLLKELINIKGEYIIGLRNIHPKYLIEMMPALREIFQSGKISFLSCAAESGNNRILELMNRGYKIEDFKAVIRTLNKEFPKIQIRSQFIVGFPTETEKEFQDTVRLLDELHFDFVEVFMFQPRPGTKAATIAGQIPQNMKKRRHLKLLLKLIFKKA